MTKKNRKNLSKNNKKSTFYDKYAENKQKKGTIRKISPGTSRRTGWYNDKKNGKSGRKVGKESRKGKSERKGGKERWKERWEERWKER